eukprot:m.35653 g.35653  ORF g.35653 m.35653 type:complete len:70 (+) comp12413_c0_seq1:1273-1482(+)
MERSSASNLLNHMACYSLRLVETCPSLACMFRIDGMALCGSTLPEHRHRGDNSMSARAVDNLLHVDGSR